MPEPPDLADRSVHALVLERHAATRIGFGLLLRSQPWIERCLLSNSRDEATALAGRATPDVAIVDVTDVGPFITPYLAPLRSAWPAMSLVLSTREGAPARVQRPVPDGAVALLTPWDGVDDMIRAVQLAVIGRARPSRDEHAALSELSVREREVLLLLSTGATNREIAQSLHVSAETVKKHAAALYRKLGVRNRTEAASSYAGGATASE